MKGVQVKEERRKEWTEKSITITPHYIGSGPPPLVLKSLLKYIQSLFSGLLVSSSTCDNHLATNTGTNS